MENLRFTKLMMMGLILFALFGCQEEEFYEKKIDGAIEKFERENRTIEEDDAAEQDIDDNDDGDDTAGGDDDGGDDTAGGDDDGGDDTAGGDDDGGDDTAGGDDDGGDDTAGGDDDGGDDTAGGDDDDGDDTPPEPNIIQKSDSFVQEGKNAKTDILWVVDNSGSMADEQQALADNFDTFIKDFASKNIDFQMGITTTDRQRRMGASQVQYEKGVIAKLNTAAMNADKDKFIADFKSEIKVGIKGYGYEKGIKSSEVFANVHQKEFMRDDAYLAIVYVSDERDQSEKSVADHLAQIQKWKSNAGLIRAYSIVDMDSKDSTKYILKGYERYKEMSDLTNGFVANLYDDFHTVLKNIASSIVNLTEEFPLNQKPMNYNEIVVKVNGFESVEWNYIEESNTIKFHAAAVPADGSTIEVIYNVEE